MMQSRLATAADAATIAAFNIAMALETEGLSLPLHVAEAGVRSLIEHPQFGFYVVAESNGRVAASMMITYEWTDWRNGVFWWLQSVYVAPACRRQGLFRKMLDFVRQRASPDSRFRGFRLYVDEHNLPAQQTYRRLGLVETGYRLFEQLAD